MKLPSILIACPIAPRGGVEFYGEVISSFPREWPLLVMLVHMNQSSMRQERLSPLLGTVGSEVRTHRSPDGDGAVMMFAAPDGYRQLENIADLNHSYTSFLGLTEYDEDDRQTKWRVRLVLDHIQIMKEASKRAHYVALIEDDALMLPGAKEYIEEAMMLDREDRVTNGNAPRRCFQYLYFGRTVGRLYAADVMSQISTLMEKRFDEKPADWLIDTICVELGLQIHPIAPENVVLEHLGAEHSTRWDEEGSINSPSGKLT